MRALADTAGSRAVAEAAAGNTDAVEAEREAVGRPAAVAGIGLEAAAVAAEFCCCPGLLAAEPVAAEEEGAQGAGPAAAPIAAWGRVSVVRSCHENRWKHWSASPCRPNRNATIRVEAAGAG